MYFHRFDWDAQNTDHIARHGLDPSEVEAACRGDALILRGRGGRYLAYGRTGEGRYLAVVIHAQAGVVRPITARDMTPKERRLYRHRRR